MTTEATNENSIWSETRDLHHACEAHPVGAAMASGNPAPIWYAAWLTTLHQIHKVIDPTLPASLGKVDRLEVDMKNILAVSPLLESVDAYTKTLTTEKALAGAAYVLTGAHLMGGEIMRRRLEGFSTTHLEWDDRKVGLAWLKVARERTDITKEVRDCFAALLGAMDEILKLYPR